jgi:hypothetical protein
MQIFPSLLSGGVALFGRWVQLHQEKIVPPGHFTGLDKFRARLFHGQVAALGTIAVSGGTYLALHNLLQFATLGSVALGWITTVIAIASAMIAAAYVRSEASARATYKSKRPND